MGGEGGEKKRRLTLRGTKMDGTSPPYTRPAPRRTRPRGRVDELVSNVARVVYGHVRPGKARLLSFTPSFRSSMPPPSLRTTRSLHTATRTVGRPRLPRTSIVAYTQFAYLAKRIRTLEQGQIWNLTKPAVQHVQRCVDAAMQAIMDVAVANQTRKTLTVLDVLRAQQFFAVFSGTVVGTNDNDTYSARFPQKFGVRSLKKRHPDLYVQGAAAAAMTHLYVGLVRAAFRELMGTATKRLGPCDVHTLLQRVSCLALVPSPPPPRRRGPSLATTKSAKNPSKTINHDENTVRRQRRLVETPA